MAVTRVCGLGTSKAGELLTRIFLVLNAGAGGVALALFANADDVDACESDFSVWLLVYGILALLTLLLGLVLVVQCWVRESNAETSQYPAVARQTTTTWFYSTMPGTLESVLALMYASLFAWLIVGSVWFIGASATKGDCDTLRLYGLWVIIGIFIFMVLVVALFTVVRLRHPPPASARPTSVTKKHLRRVEVQPSKAHAVLSPGTIKSSETVVSPTKEDSARAPTAPEDELEDAEGGDATLPPLPSSTTSATRWRGYEYRRNAAGYMVRVSRAAPVGGSPPARRPHHFPAQTVQPRSHTSASHLTEDQLRQAADVGLSTGFDPTRSLEYYLRATRANPRVHR